MAIIETYNIDGAKVEITDNAITSEEESLKIMERVTDIMFKSLNEQHRKKRQEYPQHKKDHYKPTDSGACKIEGFGINEINNM